jgi:hypothetical protein
MILSINSTLEMDHAEKTVKSHIPINLKALLLLKKLEKRNSHKKNASSLISILASVSFLKNKWFIPMKKKRQIIKNYKDSIKQKAQLFRNTDRYQFYSI